MKPLPSVFSKNGYKHKVLRRMGDVVMTALSKTEDWDNAKHWEVFFVKKRRTDMRDGWTLEAHETPPSNEEWGALGWSFIRKGDADALFDRIGPASAYPEVLPGIPENNQT